ncbi:MAG: GyrI-like domain-containing protein [Bacteroidales bacterium]
MKIALIIFLGILIIIFAFYTYYGGFKIININTAEKGGEFIVYEEVTGDYKLSGAAMDRVYYSLINDSGIETTKGFGIYYDNPRKVEKSKLRSEAGCIIEEKDLEKLSNLPENFKTRKLPVKKYIVTEFPYKGKMSVMFSIMKVYPALNKFSKEKGFNEEGAVIEIYDVPNKKILYRKEI